MSTKQKKKLQKAIISFVIAVIAIYFGIDESSNGSSSSANIEGEYQVVRVVDGDTLIILIDNVEERVRLIGIDTPESVHPDNKKNVPYGDIASDYTKSLVEDKAVELELDVQERDQYGRVLAYVYYKGTMLNKTLLEKGHATVATYPPNVKYVDDFKTLEEEAKSNNRGLWEYK
jgi:micrococcal nuclease